MKCPNCSSKMKQQKYEGVVLDICDSCGGSWLDDGEITTIIKTVDEEFSEKEKLTAYFLKGKDHRDEKTLSCPTCGKAMKVIQYGYNSGVFIDRCPDNHGIWLDDGELTKIQIFMEQQELNMGKSAKKASILNGPKRCPDDGTPLFEIFYETEHIDQCAVCGGVWCDLDELLKIIETKEKQFSSNVSNSIDKSSLKTSKQEDLISSRNCIICNKPMQKVNYAYSSGIIIDRCIEGHGSWLDKGELEKLQAYVENLQDKSQEISRKYSNILTKAKINTERSFKKAEKDGRKPITDMWTFKRFLKKTSP